jgi:uncharacterized membrane protein YqgA involved in biofilm formation
MAAVVAGAAAGALVGNRLPSRVRETVMDGLGLLTLVLGISLGLRTENFLVVMGSVLLGGLTGEFLGIERGLESVGDYLQRRFASSSDSVSAGFVTASLVFCVGPMAVLGSLEDGLHGNIDILVVKAILDGFAALAFAATLGWGVGLSALSLFVYQGTLTLAAGSLEPFLTEAMITEMTAAGGVLIMAIALRLLSMRAVRVGNLLPALLYAPLLAGLAGRL